MNKEPPAAGRRTVWVRGKSQSLSNIPGAVTSEAAFKLPMKVALKHAHRTDLQRGVARSADGVFTPPAPQGEQTQRTVIKSSPRRRRRP